MWLPFDNLFEDNNIVDRLIKDISSFKIYLEFMHSDNQWNQSQNAPHFVKTEKNRCDITRLCVVIICSLPRNASTCFHMYISHSSIDKRYK